MEQDYYKQEREVEEWRTRTLEVASRGAPVGVVRAFAMEYSSLAHSLDWSRATLARWRRERPFRYAVDVAEIVDNL